MYEGERMGMRLLQGCTAKYPRVYVNDTYTVHVFIGKSLMEPDELAFLASFPGSPPRIFQMTFDPAKKSGGYMYVHVYLLHHRDGS